MYTKKDAFEWDAEKAARNIEKHGIFFSSAAHAFDDPYALVIEDRKHSLEESRQWLVGDSEGDVLVVVFTVRDSTERIRIISARRANRRERGLYEKNKRV